MRGEQVARLLAEYVQQEIDPDGPGLYYWCELCDGDGPLKETVDHKDDCPIGALEASQQENERLRHGITAIIEGDKGDEPLETANQVVSLLEGLLAALEEQEAQ